MKTLGQSQAPFSGLADLFHRQYDEGMSVTVAACLSHTTVSLFSIHLPVRSRSSHFLWTWLN